MNLRHLVPSRLLLPALLALAVLPAAAKEPKLKPIFNGRDFTGWVPPEPNLNWRVEDGMIVGTDEPNLTGSNIATAKRYGDFILEVEIRAEGAEIDTGINLREPSFQMQIGVSRSLKQDMTGSFMTDGKGDTSRYPEAGRAKDWQKYFKKGEWNTFRLEARGNTFKSFINGHQVAEYTNPRYAAPGPISFQFHKDLKKKLSFRNIRLAEL